MERGDRRLGLWKQRWEETEEKKVTNFPESKDQNFHVSHFLSDGHTSSCSFGEKNPELVFLCFCNQSLLASLGYLRYLSSCRYVFPTIRIGTSM